MISFRNFKLTFFLVFLFSILSCQKTSDRDLLSDGEPEVVQAEIRSCWLCITEDILGFAEGATIGGFAGGPPAAIIGAAIVGSYRSAKQYNSTYSSGSNGEHENYITTLAASYNTERSTNPYNNIGKLHNVLLHNMILDTSLSTVDEYYDYMISEIKKEPEFINYTISSNLEEAIKEAMRKVDSGSGNSLVYGNDEEKVYAEVVNAFQTGNEKIILDKIAELENTSENVGEFLVLSVSFHTYFFWKNL